jgi:hypothetical protein
MIEEYVVIENCMLCAIVNCNAGTVCMVQYVRVLCCVSCLKVAPTTESGKTVLPVFFTPV